MRLSDKFGCELDITGFANEHKVIVGIMEKVEIDMVKFQFDIGSFATFASVSPFFYQSFAGFSALIGIETGLGFFDMINSCSSTTQKRSL